MIRLWAAPVQGQTVVNFKTLAPAGLIELLPPACNEVQ
jgi:hypothetical protein